MGPARRRGEPPVKKEEEEHEDKDRPLNAAAMSKLRDTDAAIASNQVCVVCERGRPQMNTTP